MPLDNREAFWWFPEGKKLKQIMVLYLAICPKDLLKGIAAGSVI